MKRLRGIWASLTGGERVVLVAVFAALSITCVFGALALVKRPEDVSNPEAKFKAGENKQAISSTNKPKDRRVDWPRYGYDTERTKFLNAQKIKPPFRKVWKYDQQELIEFAPIVNGNRLYFIDNDGVFVCLNADTGKVVWKKQYGSLNASSPAFADGALYAVTLSPGQALSIRASDGKLIWRKDLPSRAESSPIVVRDRVYLGSESGDFFALNRNNGKTIWQQKLAGSVKAAPAFNSGTLYVGDYAGHFYAIKARDGKIRWDTTDLGTGFGGSGRFYSTPAVAFGRVYAGNVDGRLYSFEKGSGEIAWTFSAGDFIYSGVAAAQTKGTKPAVYFGSHDRNVYALDAQSGGLIWKAQPGGQVSGPATVVGSVVYVSTFSGNHTIGFDLRSGRRVFKFDDGEYGPVVSDGERLYLTGGSSVVAFKPVKVNGKYKANKGFKGVIPPAELRRLRRKEGKIGGGQAGNGPEAGASGGSAGAAEQGSNTGGQGTKSSAKKKSKGGKQKAGPKKNQKKKGKPKKG